MLDEEFVNDNDREAGYSKLAICCKECAPKGDERLGDDATCTKFTPPEEASLGTPSLFEEVSDSFPRGITLIPTLECRPDNGNRGDEGALESKVSSITMSTHYLLRYFGSGEIFKKKP